MVEGQAAKTVGESMNVAAASTAISQAQTADAVSIYVLKQANAQQANVLELLAGVTQAQPVEPGKGDQVDVTG